VRVSATLSDHRWTLAEKGAADAFGENERDDATNGSPGVSREAAPGILPA
jgi:hypothetical protein